MTRSTKTKKIEADTAASKSPRKTAATPKAVSKDKPSGATAKTQSSSIEPVKKGPAKKVPAVRAPAPKAASAEAKTKAKAAPLEKKTAAKSRTTKPATVQPVASKKAPPSKKAHKAAPATSVSAPKKSVPAQVTKAPAKAAKQKPAPNKAAAPVAPLATDTLFPAEVIPEPVAARSQAAAKGSKKTPPKGTLLDSKVAEAGTLLAPLTVDALTLDPSLGQILLPKTFEEIGLPEQLLEAISAVGYTSPTLVQALCLPLTLQNKDVAGFAQTGTGKTAVFVITAGAKLLSETAPERKPGAPAILVLVPTRELAAQVESDARSILEPLGIKSLAVYGGTDIDKQASILKEPIDIVVATPGRLLDLHKQKIIKFDNICLFVCDEADRMFDMGFIDDVEFVMRNLQPEKVQKLLFSATGSEKVRELAFEYLESPEYIETNPEKITPDKITQWGYAVPAKEKFQVLLALIKTQKPECALIFTNTKIVAEWVGYKLASNGINAEVLTGDIPQNKRLSLIKKIKDGSLHVLVATDVLSRGLHVTNLTHVFNFDVPEMAENFIHRIGRTARAGAEGTAISLICEDYGYYMGPVETLLEFKIEIKQVPEEFYKVPDVSDYPFDDQGRVKSIWDAEDSQSEKPARAPVEAIGTLLGRQDNTFEDEGIHSHAPRREQRADGAPSFKGGEKIIPVAKTGDQPQPQRIIPQQSRLVPKDQKPVEAAETLQPAFKEQDQAARREARPQAQQQAQGKSIPTRDAERFPGASGGPISIANKATHSPMAARGQESDTPQISARTAGSSVVPRMDGPRESGPRVDGPRVDGPRVDGPRETHSQPAASMPEGTGRTPQSARSKQSGAPLGSSSGQGGGHSRTDGRSHTGGPSSRGSDARGGSQSSSSPVGSRGPRRDERAKETVDGALAAARVAAEHRRKQQLAKSGKTASGGLLATAGEKLAQAVEPMLEGLREALGEGLTGMLGRLGIFGSGKKKKKFKTKE